MNFQHRMNVLRADYIATLRQREQELAQQVDAASDRTGKQALCDALHQLVGTAGTHGLPDIADAARAFERAIIRLPPLLQARPLALSTEAATLSLAMQRAVSGASNPHIGASSPALGCSATLALDLPRRVLLVDDSVSIRSVARLTLERAGCLVRVLAGGAGVVEAACDVQTDFIILDVTMQPVSGTTALKALRADPRTERVPVAFLTALSELDTTALSVALKHALGEPGVLGVLHKPFTPQSLVLAVRSLWSTRLQTL
jgi:CheY-like chemotaxis protein